ncbi:FAD-binding oxidoreductase [Leifsonia sp. ZF2019]|uniref:FAD-binding oxidoreductase n=1 Tax=Leifsonia sp. ZF2019 TaxID=2781978 RepID=UPI001CBA6BA8|nr:FAD-binding oxidoreductase [Leifsonia sp. ZF2019]UAJ79713.1 FAD-binding oxidoreductase [Leifsonia sp. ZF2019]
MGIDLDAARVARLRESVRGAVFLRGDEGLAAEAACFDPTIRHDPDILVAARDEADVAAAVRFARENDLPLRIQATGQGAENPVSGGLLLITRDLDALEIDKDARRARIGAGVRWAPIIEAAAAYGLAPVTGSSTSVGAVGYTLGGGLGPLARSHGFTADWVRSFRVVTADGELVVADDVTNSDLFWALRGGKGGLGVVTEMVLELVPLTTLYGGSVFFDEDAADEAFRVWADWSASLVDQATTSAVFLRIPDVDGPPPPLRGRSLFSVRFAFPGDAAEGERLFAPMRGAAPVYLDFVGEMPTTAVATIHNDPEQGGPSWIRGHMLDSFDRALADDLLPLIGTTAATPFLAVEVRQLGGATHRDTADGTAVGGRASTHALSSIAADPATFGDAAPAHAAAIAEVLGDRISAVTNINWVADPSDPAAFRCLWPEEIFDRLSTARAAWDPERVFAFGPA